MFREKLSEKLKVVLNVSKNICICIITYAENGGINAKCYFNYRS